MTLSHGGRLVPAPPLDPEVAAALAVQLDRPSPITDADIPVKRAEDEAAAVQARDRIAALGLVTLDVEVESFDGAVVPMSLVHRPDRSPSSPLVYFVHGGGMMLGTRWSGADVFVDWIERYNAVVATVEYRRAPEVRFPVPQEDCYAGLVHLADHADALQVNVSKGILAGISAGGGLAASVALMARDRGGPAVAGQLLIAPMLDDRGDTRSTRQFPTGMWNAVENELAWRSLLGDLYGTHAVPAYAAPARAADLSRLPRPSSRPAAPRCSGTRSSPSPAGSGRTAGRPTCMSGPAGSTASGRSSTRSSHRAPRAPCATGWTVSWGSAVEGDRPAPSVTARPARPPVAAGTTKASP